MNNPVKALALTLALSSCADSPTQVSPDNPVLLKLYPIEREDQTVYYPYNDYICVGGYLYPRNTTETVVYYNEEVVTCGFPQEFTSLESIVSIWDLIQE